MVTMDQRKHDPTPIEPSGKRFRTTRWSLLLAARGNDAKAADEALETLCGAYWYPLYAFVRRKGYDAESAQDLVQGFSLRLLERRDLVSVDRGKGKFRSFLMAACSHYLRDQADHDRAAATRLRRRYRQLLRKEVTATLDPPAEVDDEIRELFRALTF
jgi:RNA polymerase sigma-70 factor (ECF subfamily)